MVNTKKHNNGNHGVKSFYLGCLVVVTVILYCASLVGDVMVNKTTPVLHITADVVSPSPNPDGNYYPLQYTEEDLFYMAQAIYYEAQGEPTECQEMVAHTIMARKYDWFYPNTIKDVVWQNKQFSYTHDDKVEDMRSEVERYVAMEIAFNVLSGLSVDTTEGSLYYFNPKLADPVWKEDYTFVKKCGGHDFYKRKETREWS